MKNNTSTAAAFFTARHNDKTGRLTGFALTTAAGREYRVDLRADAEVETYELTFIGELLDGGIGSIARAIVARGGSDLMFIGEGFVYGCDFGEVEVGDENPYAPRYSERHETAIAAIIRTIADRIDEEFSKLSPPPAGGDDREAALDAIVAKVDALPPFSRKVYEAILRLLYAEPGFSDIDANDVARELGASVQSINAALGKLEAVKLVFSEEIDSKQHPKWTAIYATDVQADKFETSEILEAMVPPSEQAVDVVTRDAAPYGNGVLFVTFDGVTVYSQTETGLARLLDRHVLGRPRGAGRRAPEPAPSGAPEATGPEGVPFGNGISSVASYLARAAADAILSDSMVEISPSDAADLSRMLSELKSEIDRLLRVDEAATAAEHDKQAQIDDLKAQIRALRAAARAGDVPGAQRDAARLEGVRALLREIEVLAGNPTKEFTGEEMRAAVLDTARDVREETLRAEEAGRRSWALPIARAESLAAAGRFVGTSRATDVEAKIGQKFREIAEEIAKIASGS